MLDKVLHLIIITWEGEQKSFSANMMNGVARLLNAFGDVIKEDVFKEKLGEISIKELTKTAKERRACSLGFAEAMLIFYSKRMRNPPAWTPLYSNSRNKVKSIQKQQAASEQKEGIDKKQNKAKNIQAG